uniref:Uncharacterized protein n=1 Tax=Romanomermis culicivorax TaxID=13658 RepID=A0A915KRC0_ROMCU
MAFSVVIFLTIVSLCAVNTQDVLTLETAKQVGDFVYQAARDYFGDSKSFNVHGLACDWKRDAGFHRWQWKYDGKITCPALGQTFNKSGCKSRDCAFKEPMKQLLQYLKDNNRISQAEFDEGMKNVQ